MTPERYERLGQLYHAALEVEPESRASFLGGACGSDQELRREVELLLAAHNNVGSYFAAPALEVAAGLVAKQENLSLTGQSFSHYRVLSLIGAGGMGEVYLAEDTRLGRKVALKLLPREFTQDQERVRRFEQEARAVSALNHPNIVTIYEVGEVEGRHFIATEYIEGETLRGRLGDGQIELREAVEIGAQMASALQAAHEAGIVHRDIKPENVMVRRDGLVKVLDFGLAKLAESKRHSTGSDLTAQVDIESSPGLVLGTLSYMSPEQARGERLDARTDVFSLGVVVYEMVAGQSPFAAASRAETLAAILDREPLPLARHAENVPVEMELIVGKALRKNKDERYQTAGELAIDLKGLKQQIEVEASLKRKARPDSQSRSVRATIRGQATVAKLENAAVRTDDAAAARTISSDFLIGGIRRRARGLAIAAAVVLVSVAALAYYFNPRAGAETIDSVAVLPFINVSGDRNTEYLSDGISDSIINSLSRLPNLKVISLNSVLRYKGQQVDPRAVGHELNVQAVLMGRMTQRGDDLVISTELVDVRDNRRLWGKQYNRKLTDVFALEQKVARETESFSIQDSIAEQIANALAVTLTSPERELLSKLYTESPEAQTLFLKGRYSWNKATPDGWNRAIAFFNQAIEKDPNYALAHSWLASTYNQLGANGILPPAEASAKAKEAALKALAIDEKQDYAHYVLGTIELFFEWDWPAAEKELERAIELNPNNAEGRLVYAHYLAIVGRTDDAVAEIRKAESVDPLSLLIGASVGKMLFYARKHDEAIEQLQRTLQTDPNFGAAHYWLAYSYLEKGMSDKAIREIEAWLSVTGQNSDLSPDLGYFKARSGKQKEARTILNNLLRLSIKSKAAGGSSVDPTDLSRIYAALGNKSEAYEWTERAFEQHSVSIVWIKVHPSADSLRSDDRFLQLLRRMKLAEEPRS